MYELIVQKDTSYTCLNKQKGSGISVRQLRFPEHRTIQAKENSGVITKPDSLGASVVSVGLIIVVTG